MDSSSGGHTEEGISSVSLYCCVGVRFLLRRERPAVHRFGSRTSSFLRPRVSRRRPFFLRTRELGRATTEEGYVQAHVMWLREEDTMLEQNAVRARPAWELETSAFFHHRTEAGPLEQCSGEKGGATNRTE